MKGKQEEKTTELSQHTVLPRLIEIQAECKVLFKHNIINKDLFINTIDKDVKKSSPLECNEALMSFLFS